MDLAVVATLALALATPDVQDARLPVPDPAAVAKAEKLIREIFRDDYARKSPPDQVALAQKLISQGEQRDGETPTRYALLREAQDLAVQGGDAPLALKAIDGLARNFLVNAVALKHAALQTTSKSARTPEELKLATARFLSLADEALLAEDPDIAVKSADSATQLARKTKELSLISRSEVKGKEASARKAALEKVVKARETLSKSPDDPSANHALGYYLCAVKGDWDSGLRLAAKGEDPTWKALAAKDLAAPGDAASQASVGDGWWDLAEKAPETARPNLRARAAFWYEKVGDGATGLTRTKVRSRLAELRMDKLGPKHLWVPLNDPQQFGVNRKPGEAIELSADEGKADGQSIKSLPPGEFDGFAARVRFKTGIRAHAGIALEDKSILAYIDYSGKYFMFSHLLDDRKWQVDFDKKCGEREEYNLCILVADGEYRAFLDGVELCRTKTTQSRIVQPGLQASHGPAIFDRIQLRKK